MAHDVFISYSSKDKLFADAICSTLEQNNIRCWIAPRDILPGFDYGSSIVSGVKVSKYMLLIFSTHSNESAHVKREVELAVNYGVTVIPFRIEDVKPSSTMEYFLSGTHWFYATDSPLDAHINNVTHYIRLLLHKPNITWDTRQSRTVTEKFNYLGRFGKLINYAFLNLRNALRFSCDFINLNKIRARRLFIIIVVIYILVFLNSDSWNEIQGDFLNGFANSMFESGDYLDAFSAYKSSAILNNSDSQQKLGYMLEHGLAVKQDYQQAFNYYVKSANQGNHVGQFSLATFYEKGLGVKRDRLKAIKFYRLSAEQGNKDATAALLRLDIK